jgi:hypothetical protein
MKKKMGVALLCDALAWAFDLPATRVEAMYVPEMFGELPNATVEVTP